MMLAGSCSTTVPTMGDARDTEAQVASLLGRAAEQGGTQLRLEQGGDGGMLEGPEGG